MKMRGYSALFVCALCLFVLCGAAAVVFAQNVTPEVEAAEAAKAIAVRAREKGETALCTDREFVSNVFSVVSNLTLAVDEITASEIPAGIIMREITDLREADVIQKIGNLKTRTKKRTKIAVKVLTGVDDHTLKDKQTKASLTSKMREVENNMTEVEEAVAAVTGNISAIDAVIEKAGALETAASEASVSWNSASEGFDRQFFKARAAVIYVYIAIIDTENFLDFLYDTTYREAQKVYDDLFDAVTNILKPSLEKLISLPDAAERAKMAARETSDQYYELQEKARMLKEAAENRRQNVQKVLQEGGQVRQEPPPSAAN